MSNRIPKIPGQNSHTPKTPGSARRAPRIPSPHQKIPKPMDILGRIPLAPGKNAIKFDHRKK